MKKSYLLTILIVIITIVSSLKIDSKSIIVNRKKYYGKNIYRASAELINKANSIKVNNYQDGNKKEMYSFLKNEVDIDYRYIGRQANNYVKYNCDNDNNCEIWRIIGVFKVEDANGTSKYRLKIMKNDSIGKYKWSNEANKDWDNSIIKEELNNTYYNSLSENAKNLIWNVKFNVNSFDASGSDAKDWYEKENENTKYSFYNIGLMYPSDYLYTYSLGALLENNNIESYKKSWMYKLKENNAWTMMTSSNNNQIYSTNNESISSLSDNYSEEYDVYPVIFLKYNTVISDGDGSLRNPYLLDTINNSNIQDENELNTEDDLKQVVEVDDTASGISVVFVILSIVLIGGGLSLIIVNYYKSKKLR